MYQIPLPFDLPASQQEEKVPTDTSFWANSFIHGSNGHDYYIAAHTLTFAASVPGAVPAYRACILDVTDPSYYQSSLRSASANDSLWDNGEFHAIFDDFGMETTSSDPLQGMHMYSSAENVEFDLTFNFTSRVFLNGALGSYLFGAEIGYEWSIPKGVTQGWLKVDGETIQVVPAKLSTYYDRQWGRLPTSFQWIMIEMEESDWLDISILAIWEGEDPVAGKKEFATIRAASTGYDSVVPLTATDSRTNVWISPVTDLVYPQEWVVTLDDVEFLITTPRPDQVWEGGPEVGLPPQFSGFIEVVASKPGHTPVKGFGAIDLIQPWP